MPALRFLLRVWHERRNLLVALGLGATACGDVARSPRYAERVAAAIGCYRLERAPGVLDSAVHDLSALRLHATALSPSRPHLRRLTTLSLEEDSVAMALLRLRLWSVDSLTDSLHVQVGDGFTGQFFAGVASGNGYAGRAGNFGDAGPPFESGVHPARLRRAPCDSIGIGEPAA